MNNFSNNKEKQKMDKIFGLKKPIFILIILVLIWVAITAVFYGPKLLTYFGAPPLPPIEEVHLGLFPATEGYQVGDSPSVEVRVDTAQTNIVAVRAIVKYDPNVFQATSIVPNTSLFPYEIENEIDNTSGEIRITRGQSTPGVNNDNALIATINFTVRQGASAGTSSITFGTTTQAPAGDSDVIKDDGLCPGPDQPCTGATDLLTSASQLHGATYIIEAAGYDADLDGDGNVNSIDIGDYIILWKAKDLAADVDGDNNVNSIDIGDYIILWKAAQ